MKGSKAIASSEHNDSTVTTVITATNTAQHHPCAAPVLLLRCYEVGSDLLLGSVGGQEDAGDVERRP